MLRAMIDAIREFWAFTKQHGPMLFLATVAAYAQQHYDLYGPPAHLLILPSLAVATFFALAKPLLDGDVTVVMANEVFASR